MEWYQIVLGVVVGLILLVVLVVIHELGHAIVARRNGVEVEEFGIGFPPLAKKLGTVKGVPVTLNWLPIGGFVKLKGENDAAKGKGTYGAAKFWPKTKILLAGVFINLLAAMAIFTVLSWTGMPKIIDNQFEMPGDTHEVSTPVAISTVASGTPADQAGLQVDDTILTINGENLEKSTDLSQVTSENKGQQITIKYERDGQIYDTKAVLRSDNLDGKGYFGVGTVQSTKLQSTWSAPIVGVVTTFQFVGVTLQGLWDTVSNLVLGLAGLIVQNPTAKAEISAAGDGVAGPIGILGVIFPSALQAGPTQVFFLMGIISLTLAIMNTLPIPGLDGGRWFLTALFRLMRKPLTREIEEKINAIGMLCLLALIVIITIADVAKL